MKFTWLFMLAILASCNPEYYEVTSSRSITLDSSSLPAMKIDYQNVENLQLYGSCVNFTDGRLEIDGNRYDIFCSGGVWSSNINGSVFPEGNIQMDVYGQYNGAWSKVRSYVLNKDTKRPNQLTSMVVTKMSQYPNSAPLILSDGSKVIVYASDEYCANPRCGVNNLVLRSSRDNYVKAYHLTKNLTYNSHFPSLVEKNNELYLSFLSNGLMPAVDDVMLMKVDTTNFDFISLSNLTSTIAVSAITPFLHKSQDGVIHLSYASREYCDANACAVPKITLRSDADNFISREYVGTHIDCGVSAFRAYINSGNNRLHFSYGLSSAGSCLATAGGGGNTVYTKKDELGVLTHSRFTLAYGFVGAAMAVDSTDLVHFIFSTTGTAFGCSGWKLNYVTSADFNSPVVLPDTCPNSSYAAYSASPMIEVDNSDVAHLFFQSGVRTDTSGKYPLSYKKSTDAFTATNNIDSDYFGSFSQLALTKNVNNILLSYGKSTTRGGIFVWNSSGPTITKVSPEITPRPRIYFENENLFAVRLSDKYCQSVGTCQRSNYVLENLQTGAFSYLTKFLSDATYALPPIYLKKSTGNIFVYSSNEITPSSLSISARNSSDSYLSRTTVLATEGNLFDALVDESDEVRLTYDSVTSSQIFFKESFLATPVLMTAGAQTYLGSLRHDLVNGRTGIVYSGNESAAWKPSIRSTSDGLATGHLILSANAYVGRSLYFTPVGTLRSLAAYDAGATGKIKLITQSESDGFSAAVILFDTTEGNVCEYNPFAQYDANGVLHVAYSLKRDGENFCNIFYRNTIDPSIRYQLTFSNNSNNYPENLFINSSNKAIVCGGSNFSVECFKP